MAKKISWFVFAASLLLNFNGQALGQSVTTTTTTVTVTVTTNTVSDAATNLTAVPNLLATNAPNTDLWTTLVNIGQAATAPVTSFINGSTNGISVKNATNYFVDIYVTFPTKNIKLNSQLISELGSGFVVGYNVNSILEAWIAFDYYSGEFFMPSGNLSIKQRIQPLKSIGIPWYITIGSITGVGTCLYGSDKNLSSLTTVVGAYGKFLLGTPTWFGHKAPIGTGFAYVQWHNAGAHTGNYIEWYTGVNF